VTRWDRLFDDLEAQLSADDSRERRAEVADRTRRERAMVDLPARLLANLGGMVVLRTPGGSHEGELREVGADWVLLQGTGGRQVLVPTSSLRSVSGLRPGASQPTLVARALTLGAALRAVSRDRAVVEVVDVDGRARTGTIDAVGSDHLELAEHPPDEPRRVANVRAVHLVPFAALGVVARLGPARS
jgi:hypothetical protein